MRLWKKILLFLILFTGIGLLAYPQVSNFLAHRMYLAETKNYQETVDGYTEKELKAEWDKAETYNASLRGDPVKDPFDPGSGSAIPDNYKEVLDVGGMMGYLQIPKIDAELPIFHGTSDEVLSHGVGHIMATALPIGGKGDHTVLTGHTGLPSVVIFDRLTEMEVGDEFFLKVLGKTLTYQVDQIKVILPDQTKDIVAHADKDLVTLITCTPYGLNTHRLLVRGTRIYDISKAVHVNEKTVHWKEVCIALAASGALLLLVGALHARRNRKMRKRAAKEASV